MKAILLAGVTSIHNFPVRTTGPGHQKHVLEREYKIFCTLVDISTRVSATRNELRYLWFAPVSVDNGYSAGS
jgi:hypothetical protein